MARYGEGENEATQRKGKDVQKGPSGVVPSNAADRLCGPQLAYLSVPRTLLYLRSEQIDDRRPATLNYLIRFSSLPSLFSRACSTIRSAETCLPKPHTLIGAG